MEKVKLGYFSYLESLKNQKKKKKKAPINILFINLVSPKKKIKYVFTDNFMFQYLPEFYTHSNDQNHHIGQKNTQIGKMKVFLYKILKW